MQNERSRQNENETVKPIGPAGSTGPAGPAGPAGTSGSTGGRKKVVLTGDRPTGALHVGHYVGSLKKRKNMLDSGEYDMFFLIADIQALTDNAENPERIRENILEVALDYLAVGLDPDRCAFVVQSQIPALFELPMYYSNLVTMARLERNPTVKAEIRQKNIDKSLPVGFATYPISQAADITAFGADYVPVGVDQLPMIEQTREIVSSFNRIYGRGGRDVLVLPEAVLPDSESQYRLVGTDGNAKMSKSLGNCIYLKDGPDAIRAKVMDMFTDPAHLRIDDPGDVESNPVFIYLDVFCTDELFAKAVAQVGPQRGAAPHASLGELKAHYRRGGVGDVYAKKLLNAVLQDVLAPIRERRQRYEANKGLVMEYLKNGTEHARACTNRVLDSVRRAIGVNYFTDEFFAQSYVRQDSPER
ncbi:MAG: tryptophan--tRNA ligase [Clostridiales bacterium]|nr:tryptophan--tRNA ligase [Clostridiales bacterium]